MEEYLTESPATIVSDNSTIPQSDSSDGAHGELPLIGYPGVLFYAIHITAISSLSISIIFSFAVLSYLFCVDRRSFHKRSIAERLVVYLALTDLSLSISHELDHSYIIIMKSHPPDIPCGFFGFLMSHFMTVQSLMVLFTALNAFMLVVKGRTIELGQRDWRLFATTFMIPFLVWGTV